MLLNFLCMFCCLHTVIQSNKELIPFEPVQYIKSQISQVNESSVWGQLNEADTAQAGELSSLIKIQLEKLMEDSGTNVVLAKGERIICKQLSSEIKMDTPVVFPYTNVLSFLSMSLTILLENFQSRLINEPLSEVLKGKDLADPILDGHEHRNFLNLLNAPYTVDKEEVPMESSKIFEDLHINGKLASYFINSVLGNSAGEAWVDALMAFGIEKKDINVEIEPYLSLNNILQYALAVIHDFHMMDKATKSMTLEDQWYLFGWWINCPVTSNECMLPGLPRDLIFSLDPALRIYISPSFEIVLIVSDTRSHLKSVNELFTHDKKIWLKVSSALQNISNEKLNYTGADSRTLYTSNDFIYASWPVLVFIFWVMSSHIWVYWMFYCCWFTATCVSKRTHILRPKTALVTN